MNAVWFVRSRQLAQSLRFWLAITGYDPRDPSTSNRIYLLYLVVFFSLWFFIVLALTTSTLSQALLFIAPSQPVWAASAAAAFCLAGWWLWRLWEASRRSPVRFSEEDAAILCAAPVSRRSTVFAWLLSEWFTSALPFWALAVVLGFARVDIATAGKPAWADAPAFLAAAMQFWLPIFLMHAGMLSLAWAFGCLRLAGSREPRHFSLYPVLLGGLLAAGLLPNSFARGISRLFIWPITSPVYAGSGLAAYFPGLLAALTWAAAGIVALYKISPHVNLSRAAQETAAAFQLSAASLLGNQVLVESIRLKERLGSGSAPSRLPARAGAWVIPWKLLVQSARGLTLGKVLGWGKVFFFSLGFFLASDWRLQLVVLVFWIIEIQDRVTQPLRSDLRQWFLYQSLPIPQVWKLAAETLPPAGLASVLGWMAYLGSSLLAPQKLPWALAVLLPLLVVILGCSAALDIFRQARSSQLLAGLAPDPGIVAVLVSGAVIGLDGVMFLLSQGSPAGWTAILLVNVLLAAMLLVVCLRTQKRLGG